MCGFIIHDDYTIDHDYLYHGYITMIGYLGININGYVYGYSLARTPVINVRVITHPHHSRCDCGREYRRRREGTERGRNHRLRCRPIRDTVDDGTTKRTTEAQDFKFGHNRPLHLRLKGNVRSIIVFKR